MCKLTIEASWQSSLFDCKDSVTFTLLLFPLWIIPEGLLMGQHNGHFLSQQGKWSYQNLNLKLKYQHVSLELWKMQVVDHYLRHLFLWLSYDWQCLLIFVFSLWH